MFDWVSKMLIPIKEDGLTLNMRASQTTACTASIRGIWKMSAQLKGGKKKSGKQRNGKMEENPRRITNWEGCPRLKDMTKVTLSSVQELRINKTKVRRKSSKRLLYTVTPIISK